MPEEVQEHAHPDYERSLQEWEFWSAAVEGGRSFKEATDDHGRPVLPQYAQEREAEYLDRRAGTPVINLCSEFARQRADAVLGTKINRPELERDGEPDELFADFVDDADGQGTALSQWLRDRLLDALTSRFVWVGVEAPTLETTAEVRTRADQLRERVRPYLVHADVRRVKDWSFDKHGVCQRVVIEYEEVRKESYTSAADVRTVSVEWFPDRRVTRTSVDDGESEVSEEPNEFGFVPWFRWEPLPGESYVARFAELQKSILLTRSHMLGEQVASAFTFRVVTGEIDAEELKRAEVGPAALLAIPGTDVNIHTLANDAGVMRELRENMICDIVEAYRRSELANKNAQLGTAQSGVSKAYDLRELSALLGQLARSCQEAENKLITFWCRALVADEKKAQEAVDRYAATSYSEDFDILTAEERHEAYERLLDRSGLPMLVRRAALKRLVTHHWPEDDAERRSLLKAVDDWKGTAVESLFGQPRDDRTGLSPAGGRPLIGGIRPDTRPNLGDQERDR